MTITQRLAAWGLELELEAVPVSVRHAASRHLLDGVGCALGAVRTGAVPAARAWADVATAPEQATILGLGGASDPSATSAAHRGERGGVGVLRRPTHVAAGVNGHLVHALDFDDTHAGGLVHATSVVLPTVLAVGEEVGATGAEALAAAVVGYETICRIAAAVPHGFHRRGLHATSVCGVFAAALIAARLRGLDEAAAVDALGIAGSLAGGSLEFLHTGSATKAIHPGLAASNGILAATLAAAGAEGPASVLEGDNGFYRAYADATVDPEAVVGSLGVTWETERITIKPYPACQLVHAPLDALRAVVPAVRPDEVAAVTITIPPDSEDIVAAPVAAKRRPRSDYEAKFSLPWSIATVLVDGDLTIDAFGPDHRDRAAVLALADRVTHVVDDHLTVAAADAPGRITITTTDGRTLDGHVVASRGGPANPLDDDALVAKFVATSGRDADTATRLLAIADAPDLRALLTDLYEES